MLHSIVTSDLHLDGYKSLFKDQSCLLHELEKIFNYALTHGIKHVFVPGDIADSPHLEYSTYISLVLLLKTYDKDLNIYYICGNHDYSDVKKTSMDLLKVLELNGFFTNFRLFLQPESIVIDKQLVNFLPYPINKAPDSKKPALNFAHIEANGAIGDNGRRMKVHDDFECKSRHFTISGHIHQYQHIKEKNLIFCGNPYQKNFGETEDKGFLEIKVESDKTCKVKHKFIPTRPEFRLRTLHIDSNKDLVKLQTNSNIRYRLYINPDVVVPQDLRLTYPNIQQILDTGSKKQLELDTTSSSKTGYYGPTHGLKKFLLKEGLNKKQVKTAKSALKEAMSELGISV
jgi:DNA repair exonuclease SbcCD nuclease subunit